MNVLNRYAAAFKQIEDKAERFRFLLIQCFIFSLPFDRLYSSVILILLSVVSVFDINLDKLKSIPRQFLIFQSLYLLSLLWYFMSYHKQSAGFVLEKQMALFLFPLILPLAINFDAEKLKTSIKTLCAATITALLYLFTCVIWEVVFDLQLPISSTLSSGLYFNHQFSKPLDIHAGYLSLYVAMAIVFLIRTFKRQLPLKNKLLLLIALVLLFVGMFFLASRNTILAVCFILLFVMPFFRLKKKFRYFSVMIVLLVIGFLVVNKVPYLKQRFSSEMVMDLNSNAGITGIENFKVLEPRFDRWSAAMDLVRQSPLLGFGTGDEEAMLKTAYMQNGLYISYILAFNAHNQYLSVLIKHGFVGLIILLLSLFYYFRLAIQARDFMYLSFLLFMGIGFFTENILDANKGIFFFALFNTFFGYHCLKKRKITKSHSAVD